MMMMMINILFQVIFKRRMIISGIAVQGKKSSNNMVQKYMLEYSVDKVTRKMYTENGIVKVGKASIKLTQ